MKRGGAGC